MFCFTISSVHIPAVKIRIVNHVLHSTQSGESHDTNWLNPTIKLKERARSRFLPQIQWVASLFLLMFYRGLFIPCFAQIPHRNYFAILGVVLFFSWLASIIRLKKQRGFDSSTKREWKLSQKYCLLFQRRLNKYIPSFNTPLFLLYFRLEDNFIRFW